MKNGKSSTVWILYITFALIAVTLSLIAILIQSVEIKKKNIYSLFLDIPKESIKKLYENNQIYLDGICDKNYDENAIDENDDEDRSISISDDLYHNRNFMQIHRVRKTT